VRPGDVVTVAVTYGAPHHLVADGPVLTHRRTRAGALFEERGPEAGLRPTTGSTTGLGLPGFGAPAAPEAVAAGCRIGTGVRSAVGTGGGTR
jgi:tRNA-2-methylthio-N6-dimethylallyladenosine synthase